MEIKFHIDNSKQHNTSNDWEWLTNARISSEEHEFLISLYSEDYSKISLKAVNGGYGVLTYKCNSGKTIKLMCKKDSAPNTYIIFATRI